MHTKLIIEIQTNDRNRKLFNEDKLRELADSIHRVGLIQLPVCRQLPDGGIELVAGERRMRAIALLHEQALAVRYMGQVVPQGCLPYALTTELSPLEAREIELDENLRRVDLTWQEVANATAQLHRLRSEQIPDWTKGDTAGEIKNITGVTINPTKVSNRLLLAQEGHRFASVMKAKTEDEAFRLLSRELEQEVLGAIGRLTSVGVTTAGHELLHGDAVMTLRTMPAEIADVFLTDPPYGIGADTFGFDSHTTMSQTHSYADDWDKTIEPLMVCLFPELFRVAKKQAHLYMFCDISKFFALSLIAQAVGWNVWPRPLIWAKTEGNAPAPQYGPRYMYETILYANKGHRPTIRLVSDVISVPNVSTKLHAAQKPVGVYVDLLARSVIPGNTVIDPFAGSGTIFEAAHVAKCQAIGIELDDAAFATAKQRLEGLK